MTAPRSARDLAATRDKLTAALEGVPFLGPLDRRRVLDALLPVVAEAIADELCSYADDLDRVVVTSDWSVRIPMAGGLDCVAQALRARAADIREKAGRP